MTKKEHELDPQISEELSSQRRQVSYDSYDILIRQLVDLVSENAIDIAPEYQRQFVWTDANQSKLIESIFLGIPIPSLFMATNSDSSWEVIDGVQRISTVIRFCGSPQHLAAIKNQALRLTGLEKLKALNGKCFSELPPSVQLGFMLKSLKVTTLNDRSDTSVRFDLFERLNTGGVKLEDQEIRACIYRGRFNDFLRELAQNTYFRRVVKLQVGNQRNGTYEEFVLRFFAFLHDYKSFEHEVKSFLTDYMRRASESFDEAKDRRIFHQTFKVLASCLPDGIVRPPRKSITPVNLYEGIAVGTALAIRMASRAKMRTSRLPQILTSAELRQYTSSATNSQRMVSGRIECVRDRLTRT